MVDDLKEFVSGKDVAEAKKAPPQEFKDKEVVEKLKYGGVLGKIWRHKEYKTLTLEMFRVYKSSDGDFKYTQSLWLRLNDLPKAELMVKKAYAKMLNMPTPEK